MNTACACRMAGSARAARHVSAQGVPPIRADPSRFARPDVTVPAIGKKDLADVLEIK